MLLELMIGNVLVLSQSHAFDSGLVLDLVAKDEERDQFLDLVKRRYVIFVVGEATVQAAMLKALANPTFRFSGWPELSRGLDRAALRAALTEPTVPRELGADDQLAQRIDALKALDRAVGKAERSRAQLKPLSAWIAEVLDKLTSKVVPDAECVARALAVVAHHEDRGIRDARSAYYESLDRFEMQPGARDVGKELVDACYNRGIAQVVGAERRVLTTTAKEPAALLAAGRVVNPLIGVNSQELAGVLTKVGWVELARYLPGKPGHKLSAQHWRRRGAKFLVQYDPPGQGNVLRLIRAAGVAGGLASSVPMLVGSLHEGTLGFDKLWQAIVQFAGGSRVARELVERTTTRWRRMRLERRFYGLLERGVESDAISTGKANDTE
jgi:hypothetical protein